MKKYIAITIAFTLTVLGSLKLYSGYEKSMSITKFNVTDIYCSGLLDLPVTPNQSFCSEAERLRGLLYTHHDIQRDNREVFFILGFLMVLSFLTLTVILFDDIPQVVRQEDSE